MLSSTSSSNQRLPSLRWDRLLGAALLVFVLLVAAIELSLAWRGIQPTVADTEALWLQQRARAGALGDRALILLGSSRIQLDADLDVLRRQTGLEPVQLAIDGSNFRPVLAGLAADPAIRGTVIVDFADALLTHPQEGDTAHRWQASYDRSRGRLALPDFAWSEGRLQQALRGRLRSYADGAQPLAAVLMRVLPKQPLGQYVVMRADRSRLADYGKVGMPAHYFERVLRELGQPRPQRPGMTWTDLDQELRSRISALSPETASLPAYEAATRELAQHAATIRERGGRVHFVMLPRSGLVRAIDAARYPRAQFWDRFAAQPGILATHFDDVPAWRELQCPDGSHLDYRQRAAFSAALAARVRS